MTRVVIDQKIRHGKPIIKGTRITVEEVLGALVGGMNFKEIEKEYGLTENQIRDAIAYAFAFLRGEEIKTLDKVAV